MGEKITVPVKSSDNATLLLAAAEELSLPAWVVETSEEGFVVPVEVHEKAFGKAATKKAEKEQADEGEPEPKATKKAAKKAPAKKAAAKDKE